MILKEVLRHPVLVLKCPYDLPHLEKLAVCDTKLSLFVIDILKGKTAEAMVM